MALVLDRPTVVASPAPSTHHHRCRRRLRRTAPLFSSFTVEHPHTVALDGLNVLSDAIALYHNNDRLLGPLPHAVRKPQPRLTIPLRRPRPLLPPSPGSSGNVSFQTNERRDGRQPLDNGRQRHMFSVLRRSLTSNTFRSCPSRGRRQL